MIKLRTKENIFFLIIIFLVGGFGFVFFRISFFTIIQMCILLFFTFFSVVKNKGLPKVHIYILIYFLLIVISAISSHFINNQSIYYCLRNSYHYIGILSFYIPYYLKLSSKQIYKTIIYLSVLFCICYIYQWQSPTAIFAPNQSFISGDEYRVRLPGSICCYFLFLYSWSRILITKKKVYFLLLVLSFLPILIQGFRSLVVLSLISILIITYLMIRKKSKSIIISILFAVSIGLSISFIPIVNDKLNEMLSRQKEEQTFSNKDYVRNVALIYYWEKYSEKPLQLLTGGGIPDSFSRYSSNIERDNDMGLYLTDLGIVGLGFMIGFPAILILIYLIFISIRVSLRNPIRVPFSLLPISITLFIVLIGSIMLTSELYRQGNLLFIGIYLYLIWIRQKEYRIAIFNQTKNENRNTYIS